MTMTLENDTISFFDSFKFFLYHLNVNVHKKVDIISNININIDQELS